MAVTENSIPASVSSPFKVIQQTSQFIDVEFTLPSYDLSSASKDGISYRKLSFENAGSMLQPGMPDVPTFSAYIAIPFHGSISPEIIARDDSRLSNFIPYPQQDDSAKSTEQFSLNRDYYTHGGIYPQQTMNVSDPQILRDLRIVNLTLYPFSYDANSKSMTVSKTMRVRISFNSTRGINELDPPVDLAPSFEPIYRAQVLNYGMDRDVAAAYSQERILMIVPYTTDSTFLARLYSLIDWKKQKGYQVSYRMLLASPTTVSVKTVIQDAYDSLAVRPTYVILIGDASGTFTIPTWMHSWSSYSGEGDYPYTLLAGNDLLGDVLIGRMSISSYTDFQTLTGKGYLYERDIDISTAAWLNKLLLVGDTTSSGISTIYTNKYIKEISSVHNPSLTYTEVYASPFPSQMDAGINAGCGFFNYRGYIGMSSWSPTASEVNGYKLPHAVIITCGTGTFANGTSTTETFVRLGTSDTPKGAVTAIGMATSGTHTMLNNCLNGGIFQGIYTYDMHTMGQALLNGKLYLHRIYYVPDPDLTEAFQHICNLIGDPTLEVFTGIPSTFSVRIPSTIPVGSNQIEVIVNDTNGVIVPNATVTCYKRGAVEVSGLTGSDGKFIAVIPNTVTDSVAVTVSKQNFKPSISYVKISASGGLVFNSTTIDDDNVGASSGNGNGTANAGETIELQVGVKNTTAAQINSVAGVLSTTTTGCTILTSSVSYGNIAAGGTANGATKYVFHLANNFPDYTPINFKVNLSDSGTGRYNFSFQVISRSGDMDITNVNISDLGNGVLDPGETTNLILTVKNNGQIPVNTVYATLSTSSNLITINDASATFGTINNGSSATCSTDAFNISGKSTLVPGMVIPMNIVFNNGSGYSETEAFTLNIGVKQVTDPVGPDTYGHFIYDTGDTTYSDAPTYQWEEVSPLAGGSGTQVSVTDVGITSDEGDQTNTPASSITSIITVTMPFTFRLYGVDYTQASICSNGFIGMGASADGEFRNYTLPGALGPNPMIAAFWDDLSLPTGSGVYQYYNSVQHFWVVEWYQAKNGYDQVTDETFEAILYDPAYYPTSNGDGMIKLQYKVFNNIDAGVSGYTPTHGNYCTVGIKDHTGTDGLQYTFNNTYPTAAMHLGNEKALLITAAPEYHESAYLTIADKSFIDGNNGIIEPNEDVQIALSLMNMGEQTGHNISATLSTTDSYATVTTPTASYAAIAPDQSAWGLSFFQVHIASGCPNNYSIPMVLTVSCTEGSWQRYFSMTVTKPGLYYDNYFINDQAGNNNGIPNSNESILLIVNANNTGTINVSNVNMSLSTSSPNVTLLDTSLACGTAVAGTKLQKAFRVNLGTITNGTLLTFNLTITGTNMTTVTKAMLMTVGSSSMTTDFESNNGDFTAIVPSTLPGWVYGTTTKITDNTTHLWATDLTSNYPDYASWDLLSPLIPLGTGSTLSFWHEYCTEANYDGGVVYISTDGGTNWTIISPNGGYPNSSSSLAIHPAYSTITAGVAVTGTATFDLSAYAGNTVMFKWHFFSDISINNKGWFIDNVVVSGVVTKTGRITGTITLSPTSSNVTNTVVKAGSYTTHPATDGSYTIYLPNGTYATSATLTNYSVPSTQSLTVSDANPNQTGNFTLEFLSTPPTLSCTPAVGSIPLSWASRDERLLHFDHYNVFRRINGDIFRKITEVTGTSYIDTPTINGTYYYYVTKVYTEGESGASNTVSFTYPPPTAPNSVALVSPTNGATGVSLLPTVSWTPNSRVLSKGELPLDKEILGAARESATREPATDFYVYCDTNSNPTTLLNISTASPYTFTTSLAYSTTYYWKVVAHNAYGFATGNTVYSFTTMANPNPPNPVTLTSPSNGATGVILQPTVSWTPSGTGAPATSYYVYCDTNSNPTTLVGSPTSSPYTFTTPLNYATTYYWKVVAHNANGNSSSNTVWSFTTMNNPTPLDTPTEVGLASTESGLELSWGSVYGATIYRIYATTDINSANWGTPIAVVNAPDHSWTDTSGIPWRFYRVTADNIIVKSAK